MDRATQMPTERRQARVLAMQALCQWDVQGDESLEVLDDFLTAREASKSAGGYATELVTGFWAGAKEIDRRIAAAAHRWELARISPVERNIMRMATAELLSEKVPPKAVLNEAIEIAREYGGEDSPGFVNGVLDEVLKSFQRSQKGNG